MRADKLNDMKVQAKEGQRPILQRISFVNKKTYMQHQVIVVLSQVGVA